MSLSKLLAATATAAVALLASPIVAAQTSNKGLRVIGLTSDQRLVSFNSNAPKLTFKSIGTIAGLSGDTGLVGIDYRVQDGLLYGVGDAGGVYKLDTSNATASLVNRLATATADPAVTTPVTLTGTRFGVDFNPAADRLRIVSDTGQNLRHNVNAGGLTLVDGALNNGAVPPVTVTGVASAAYVNNDIVASTGTLLYDINANAGTLVLQVPPNSGALNTVGTLGLPDAVIGRVGFDIYSQVNRDGVVVDNIGFAAVTTAATGTRLYSVSLTSGVATDIGSLKAGEDLLDIALPLAQ